jgi:hypothetical protein
VGCWRCGGSSWYSLSSSGSHGGSLIAADADEVEKGAAVDIVFQVLIITGREGFDVGPAADGKDFLVLSGDLVERVMKVEVDVAAAEAVYSINAAGVYAGPVANAVGFFIVKVLAVARSRHGGLVAGA